MANRVLDPFSFKGSLLNQHAVRATMQSSLGKKLFYFSFLCIFIVFALVGITFYLSARWNMEEQVGNGARQSVEQVAGKLDMQLKSYQAVARQLMLNQHLLEALERVDGKLVNDPLHASDRERIQQTLNSAASAYPEIAGVRLVSQNYAIGQDTRFQLATSIPTSDLVIEAEVLDIIREVDALQGGIAWIPTSRNGLFGKKGIEVSKNFSGPTFSLAQSIRNIRQPEREWIMVIEIKTQVIASIIPEPKDGESFKVSVIAPDGKVIYSSEWDELEERLQPPTEDHLISGFWYESGLYNGEQTTILTSAFHATVTPWMLIRMEPAGPFFRSLTDQFIWLSMLAVAIILLISFLLAFYTRQRIVKPITMISDAVDQISQGASQIDRVQVSALDEIGELASAINVMADLLEQIRRGSQRIKLLLDHTGQGFMSINSDLIVEPEYSAACEPFFMGPIVGQEIHKLFFPHDLANQQFMLDVLQTSLNTNNRSDRETYLSLLPQEIRLHGRSLNVQCRFPDDQDAKQVLFVLSDVTRQRQLEKQLSEDHQVLNMVVHVVTHHEESMELIHDFEHFASGGWRVKWDPQLDVYGFMHVIMGQIHTYRGHFSQFGFLTIPKKLSMLESDLQHRIDLNSPTFSIHDLERWFSRLPMLEWLDEDRQRLQQTLGDGFLRQMNMVMIPRARLLEFEGYVLNHLPPYEAQKILNELKRLQVKSLHSNMTSYPQFAQELAQRIGKSIQPFQIEGDSVLVDMNAFRPLIKSFVHLFRNMLDHGIEFPDERLVVGKPEVGMIFCRIRDEQTHVQFEFGDDGRGIDYSRVRARLIAKGILAMEEAVRLDQEQLHGYLLRDGCSTREEVTDLSGRGVGLSAVYQEINQLNGTITIQSELGKGTTFVIRVPMQRMTTHGGFTMDQLMEPFRDVAINVLTNQFGLEITRFEAFTKNERRLPLQSFTTMIFVRGVIEGYFMMTANMETAEHMSSQFVLGELTEEERMTMMEEVVGESLNLMLGQSFKRFPQIDEFIRMETPITFVAHEPTVKYFETETRSYRLQTLYGDIQISFILMDQLLSDHESV